MFPFQYKIYFTIFSIPFIGSCSIKVEFEREISIEDIFSLEKYLSENLRTYNTLEITKCEKIEKVDY